MRGLYLSRLDYVFSKLPSAILFDLQPVCRTKWEFGHTVGSASEHVPVFFSLSYEAGSRILAIPRWVPRHPEYSRHCNDIIAEVRRTRGNPFHHLARFKHVMRDAAIRTLRGCALAQNLDVDQQIYWSLIALRFSADTSNKQFRNSLESYPYLKSFMSPDGILFDIDALGHHVAKLNYDKGCTALMERPKEGEEPEILKIETTGCPLGSAYGPQSAAPF